MMNLKIYKTTTEANTKEPIVQYIRRRRRGQDRKIGVLVGVPVYDSKGTVMGFDMGFALCHKLDTFNRDKAMNIALGRALARRKDTLYVPHSIADDVKEFRSRCERYFKSAPQFEIFYVNSKLQRSAS